MALPQSDAMIDAVTLEEPAGDLDTESGWRKFFSILPLVLSGGWVLLVVVMAVGAETLPIDNPAAVDPVNRLQGPSGDNWFGTDGTGRDIFARSVHGSRVSLIVGVTAALIGMVIGGSIGIVAGYLRGKVDWVISWLMDVILSFPALVLLIALVSFAGGGLRNISLALGFLSIPVFARLARAYTLSVGGEDFVLAARASGAGRLRVLVREITPNVLPALTAYGLISMSQAIVVEGSLSFLGLSVSAPTSSWGGLIADGQRFIKDSRTGVILPAAVLVLTVLALNVLGERFRRRYEIGQS